MKGRKIPLSSYLASIVAAAGVGLLTLKGEEAWKRSARLMIWRVCCLPVAGVIKRAEMMW